MSDNFLEHLQAHSNNPEAIIGLYEEMKEKPMLNQQSGRIMFLAISQSSDRIFDKYFKVCKSYATTEELYWEMDKRSPDKNRSKKICHELSMRDPIDSLDNVIVDLRNVWKKNDTRFHELLEKHKKKILDMLEHESNNSVVSYLVTWFSRVRNDYGWQELNDLTEKMGIDLFGFCKKYHVKIGNNNYLFNLTDWTEFEVLAQRYADHAPEYKVFMTIASFGNPFDTIKRALMDKPEIVAYLWTHYYRDKVGYAIKKLEEEGRHTIAQQARSFDNVVDSLFFMIYDTFDDVRVHLGMGPGDKNMENRIVVQNALYYAEMEHNLKSNKIMPKKVKI